MQRSCPRARVDKRERTQEADLFKALADPYRLRIIATLYRTRHEVCVCDFTDAFPLKQPAVSHHLAVLRDAGIVRCERRGTWVYYTLADDFSQRLEAVFDRLLPERIAA
jgi:ArsR family transcriptional regulator, arsenate/arsenite/antimonite-responsive transcriptional repressor